MREAVERIGQIDILVNNAGLSVRVPLADIDDAHFDELMTLNVRAPLFLTQQAAKHMHEGGRVVNISSGAANAGVPSSTMYAATKAALDAMTRVHAAELGGRNITVNAVSPGPTVTDMQQADDSARMEALRRNTALGRFGQPPDIADVVAFLASDDARWITGQVLAVNGGLRA